MFVEWRKGRRVKEQEVRSAVLSASCVDTALHEAQRKETRWGLPVGERRCDWKDGRLGRAQCHVSEADAADVKAVAETVGSSCADTAHAWSGKREMTGRLLQADCSCP